MPVIKSPLRRSAEEAEIIKFMTKEYDFAIELVRKAGKKLKSVRPSMSDISHKGEDIRDVVTNADIEINNFLISEIKKIFPEHAIYSEEGMSRTALDNTEVENKNEYKWVIDPIDGSSNFSRGIPHFAVCVGLLHNDVPIVGAVYNPITDELFSFEKDHGAFFNGEPMQVSQISDLKKAQSLLTVGHQTQLFDWGEAVYRSFLENIKKMKMLGSSSLDLCFLASGRADIVVYGTLTTLDVASSIGIVRASGGEVYTPEGNSVELSAKRQTIVATANPELLKLILPLLHTDLLPNN